MNLVAKYLGAGSVVDRSVGGCIGRIFGRAAGVPSSIAFSAGKAWNESKQVYAEGIKEQAAAKILGYGKDRVPSLHLAWGTAKETAKHTEQAKKNLAMSGLPCNQYIQEIQAMDQQVRQAESECQRQTGVSFNELDSCFGKFISGEDFKATAKRSSGPALAGLEADKKVVLEDIARGQKAVEVIDSLIANIRGNLAGLGI